MKQCKFPTVLYYFIMVQNLFIKVWIKTANRGLWPGTSSTPHLHLEDTSRHRIIWVPSTSWVCLGCASVNSINASSVGKACLFPLCRLSNVALIITLITIVTSMALSVQILSECLIWNLVRVDHINKLYPGLWKSSSNAEANLLLGLRCLYL